MEFQTATSPHLQSERQVGRLMLEVMLALVPGVAALTWFFGWGTLINMAVAAIAALLAEAIVVRLRGRAAMPVLRDGSALLTALLLAIALPPLAPWWLVVLGTGFAIIIAKHLYGGLGYNPFNPAMAGYALLLISFPVEMTRWLPPSMLAEHSLDLSQSLALVFSGTPPTGLSWDAISSATPLDEMRTRLDMNQMISEIRQSPLWGDFGGRGWEWVGNWFLLGGLYLLWRRVISWHIPVSMLGSLLLIAGLFWLIDPETHPHPAFHMFSGAAIFGAFFIATDPVTACTTKRGQLVYGALIGVLIFIIRSWGAYPDAVAFAVLLMNMAAPTIDYYTQPRVFGERRDDP